MALKTAHLPLCCMKQIRTEHFPAQPDVITLSLEGRASMLTLDEASEELRISRRQLSTWITEGKLEAVKLGHAKRSPIRIPRAAIEAFLRDRMRGAQ
jgi:excisionase family DNA binding protein